MNNKIIQFTFLYIDCLSASCKNACFKYKCPYMQYISISNQLYTKSEI